MATAAPLIGGWGKSGGVESGGVKSGGVKSGGVDPESRGEAKEDKSERVVSKGGKSGGVESRGTRVEGWRVGGMERGEGQEWRSGEQTGSKGGEN